MVTSSAGLWERITGYVRDDFQRLSTRLQAMIEGPPSSGLYTYRCDGPESRHRLHLRVHDDSSAVVFVNATQALHLPPSMGHMLYLALEGSDPDRAVQHLRVVYPDVATGRLAADYGNVQVVAEKLQQQGSHCRVKELGIEQPPPFSVRARAPYKADIALHYECNNHCSHCYNEPGRKASVSLPIQRWEEVLQRLYDIGVPYIVFTGGEPTLHPDLVRLVAHAETLGQITGVNTNGRALADPSLVENLLEGGLDHVQITLASHRREVHNEIVAADAFDETVAGIRNCLDAGLHVLTNTTLLSNNVAEALDIVDFLHDLGLKTFAMNGMIHSGCGARHPSAVEGPQVKPVLQRVRNRAEQYDMRFLWYTPTMYCRMSPLEIGLGYKSCNAAEYSICIEPDGDVLPCQSYYKACGNILDDPWDVIWNSPLFRRLRFRRERPAEAGLPEKCHECEQLMVCGGGCPLQRRAEEEGKDNE
ncbi:MAG: radical SAM protein [Armatimonadota bacterium]